MEDSAKAVIEKYGYIDTNGRPSLYCTVTSIPNAQRLFLSVTDDFSKLCHEDETLIAQWAMNDLVDRYI